MHIYVAYTYVHRVGSCTCMLRGYFAAVFLSEGFGLHKERLVCSPVLSGNVRGWLSGVKEGSRDREYCVDLAPLPAAAAWEDRVQDPSPRGPQADRRGAASRAGASAAGQAPGEGPERPGGELA